MRAEAGRSPIRVLLVEDDEDDYLLTRDALRSIGPERMVLEWVETGARALDALASGSHDVCLLDYRLGGMTGLELLTQARRRGWRGPAILLTGVGDDEVDERALEAGASDFLVKSELTPTLLARSIRYALRHARTLEALRRSQESFHQLIERLPDGIGVVQEERLVYVNHALVTLLGCHSPAELVGRTQAELEETFLDPESRTARASQARPPGEVLLRRTGGGNVPVELAAIACVFDGRPSRLHLVRDLTERKQMEARLLRSDRMASLGTLAAGIAHEINNPLAFMTANLEHLGTEVLPRVEHFAEAREEAQRLVSETRQGTSRVRDIVRQLKLFSRTEEDPRTQPVDAHRVLETAISMASNEIRHRARLVRDYAERLVVEADEGRLGQVLLNLLVNAAQAIPEGSVERHEIRVRTRPHAEGALIEVSDTGVGIAARHLERVFEPFFTTKPLGVGTGLGLSICHGIVARFGGRMEVESEVGKGSTFRVLLRAAAGHEAPRPHDVVVPEPPRRARVLVVDDEPLIGLAIRRMLQRAHEVVALTSAREARSRLLEGERFDVILCDVMMPEMSGMELHQELASRAPALAERLVFLTGGAFTASARAYLHRVGNRRMEKPFSSEDLFGLVRSMLVEPPSGAEVVSAPVLR